MQYLHSTHQSVDKSTKDLLERNLDLLIELAEGNLANQQVLFENKGAGTHTSVVDAGIRC